MKADPNEHRPWSWLRHPWLGPHHLAWPPRRAQGRRVWLPLRQWVRAPARRPARPAALWRPPTRVYLLAALAQGVVVAATVLLSHVVPAFAFPSALPLLVVAVVALRGGTGPSLLTTLLGAVLVQFIVLPPHAAWGRDPAAVVQTLVFVSVGLCISGVARHTTRAHRLSQEVSVRYAQIYASEHLQREKAEVAVRMRDDILNLATHDLRAPLTSILSRAQLVQYRLHRDTPPEAAWITAQMQAIGAAVTRLSGTIDEMGDVARLQIGQALELHLDAIDIGALVQAVVAEAGGASRAVLVDVRAPVDAVYVHGDRARLFRVLRNLVDNAVKYSAQGTPVCVDVQGQGPWAVITVRDRGVGIPATDLPHVFTRFFRAANARGIPGTGLGLAGAKAIIEQQDGQITLDSALGVGTTVTIRLPRAADA